MRFFVIIPASGTGSRFGSKTPKQFLKLKPGNKEVLSYCVNKFAKLKEVESITIAASRDNIDRIKNLVKRDKAKNILVVEGGKERHDSVFNALASLNCENNDRIIIHDAVRPFITVKKIKELISESKRADAVIPGLKINDTLKKVSKGNIVTETVPRDNIWRVQTPQIFKYSVLIKAFDYAKKNKLKGTDEAYIVEAAGYKVKITEGETSNIKITTKEDLKVIDFNKLLK